MYHNLGIVKWSAVHAWNIHVMRALNSYLFWQNFYSIKPSPAIHDVYMCVFEVNGVKSFKDFSSPSKNAKTTVIYFNSFLKSIIQTKCYYWSEINIPAIQLRKYSEIVNAPFNTGMLSYFAEVSKCTVKLGHVRFYTRHSFHSNAISLVHWYKPARS